MKNRFLDKKWNEIISRFIGKTILVIGDVMLDEYIWGEVERISPEAPVPVVRVNSETWVPGGAANVAHNISSLGGRPIILGVIGSDPPGRKLKKLLRQNGIDPRRLIVDPRRPTVTKSRILAGHQQVVRIDREYNTVLGDDLRGRLLETVHGLGSEIDGIILEDYAKGVISQEVIPELIEFAHRRNHFLVVDPNGSRHFTYHGADLVTPNYKEAIEMAGKGREVELERLGRTLLQKWGSASVLITLGEEGMCLFERRKKLFHIPTVAREVFDVSGAGDTVIGTVALALAAGADLKAASFLANCAAGVVVGKLGTATVTPEELRSTLNWQ
ncbi:MAG: D-glycero-beta-D-manno-heptose-7-phosphate kinase [Candidatus Euphemobacter frigidus]|nr:D-glycero-beta-D-manno-heptose-7-phosphate kinase [Candidatus Euphemobacter frigidus]MDP8275182.1 D-glycero-beta-D-manno-heptose-7-phosphate kinase [Candidatus Euphemobacter frigidus]